MNAEQRFWVALNMTAGIGPVRMRQLLERFGTAQQAWQAPAGALAACGLEQRTVNELLAQREALDLDATCAAIDKSGVQVITWNDEKYPAHLKTVDDSPPLLYLRGELKAADNWSVAVVGTRKATTYGREVTRELCDALVRAGVTIVSGLARGIDEVAHSTALAAGGRTLAVLGSGLDKVYPLENRLLAQRIAAQGALISDYPPGTAPDARNFPPRNRIISGLALAVIVVEAGERSGALITAQFAADQGREVMAVPGSILSHSSRGTNRLIRDGARPVLSADDVLEELSLRQVTEKQSAQLELPVDGVERTMLSHLSREPLHVDDLSLLATLPVAQVSSALAMLELKGFVRQVGGMQFVLARELPALYEAGR
jgi:DNA processing protein